MAKRKGFNLADTATLIGFIIGILATWVLGWKTGLIALLLVIIIYMATNKKKVGNVILGGLVGFLIGLVINILVGAIFTLF